MLLFFAEKRERTTAQNEIFRASRVRHRDDDDDDDDEEKDGDAFVVGVDVRVRLCSRGAFEALVALGDDAGGLGARFDEASSTLGAG